MPLLLLVLLSSLMSVAHQQQPSPQPLDIGESDPKRIADLQARGRRTDGTLVVLWTPAGALTEAETRQLVDRLDKGVAALRTLIGRHPWQAVRDQRIVFYVSEEPFVAHSKGDEVVMIPLARVRDGRAPFLHETAHALTARAISERVPADRRDPSVFGKLRATRPLWLIEGLADYLAKSVMASSGLTEGDIFEVGNLQEVDTTCASRLVTPIDEQVLPFIGQLGEPSALRTTDRAKVAPTFYACALSFTKFLVGRIGVHETIALMALQSRLDSAPAASVSPDEVIPRIETLTGQSMDALRTTWLRGVKEPRR